MQPWEVRYLPSEEQQVANKQQVVRDRGYALPDNGFNLGSTANPSLNVNDVDALTQRLAKERPGDFVSGVLRGTDVGQSMLGSAIQATGELTNTRSLTQYGTEMAEQNQLAAGNNPNRVGEFTDIKGISSFIDWGQGAMGEALGTSAPALVGGLVGAAATPAAVPASIGAFISAAIASYPMAVGEIQANIKEKGGTAPGAAFIGGIPFAMLDAALPGHVASKALSKYGAEAGTKVLEKLLSMKAAKEFGVEILKGGNKEGVTEVLQNDISEIAASMGLGTAPDYASLKERTNAYAAGAVGGAGMTTPVVAKDMLATRFGEGARGSKGYLSGPLKSNHFDDELSKHAGDALTVNDTVAQGTKEELTAAEVAQGDGLRTSSIDSVPPTAEAPLTSHPHELTDVIEMNENAPPPEGEIADKPPVTDRFDPETGEIFNVDSTADRKKQVSPNPYDDMDVEQLEKAYSQAERQLQVAKANGQDFNHINKIKTDIKQRIEAKQNEDSKTDNPNSDSTDIASSDKPTKQNNTSATEADGATRSAVPEQELQSNVRTEKDKETAQAKENSESGPVPDERTETNSSLDKIRSTHNRLLELHSKESDPKKRSALKRKIDVVANKLRDEAKAKKAGPERRDQSIVDQLPDVSTPKVPTSDARRVRLQEGKVKGVESELDNKAHEAATSPDNDLPEPTQAQKEAGNYKVGKVKLHGLDLSIENPKGSFRSGKDKNGKEWSQEIQHHYGYIKGTEAIDGDQVDIFLGSEAESDSAKVFVIDQVDPNTKEYDEAKVMFGFQAEGAAIKAYLSNYEKGWKGNGGVTAMSLEEFKTWVDGGDHKNPLSPKVDVKPVSTTNQAVSEERYHVDKVKNAYRHISNSPGRAAKAHEESFDRAVKEARDLAESKAETPEQKTALESALKQFRIDYMKNEQSELNARENTVSWHKAGRDNFDKKGADKGNKRIDDAAVSFSNWVRANVKSVKAAVLAARTEEQKARDDETENREKTESAYNKHLKDIATNIAAMSEPGMSKAAFRPKALKAFNAAIEGDKGRALEFIEKLGKKLESDGGLKKVVGSQSDLWKAISRELVAGKEQAPVGDKPRAESADKHEDKSPDPETSIERLRSVKRRLSKGELSLEEYRDAYQWTKDNLESLRSEFGEMTVAELKKHTHVWDSSAKKARYVDSATEGQLEAFVLTGTLSYMMGGDMQAAKMKAIDAKVAEVTESDLQAFAEQQKAALENYKSKVEDFKKSLEDPETVDQFQAYMRNKISEGMSYGDAYRSLSPGQREQYDELSAELTRERREEQKKRNTQTIQAGVTTGAEIVETTHTRGGYDLFVVKPADRVDKAEYKIWLTTAKKLGGWYSRYSKGGAVPGFQFKDKEHAKQFHTYITEGDTEGTQAVVDERKDAFKDDKSKSTVERLRDMAKKLNDRAVEYRDRDRKTNTARRAQHAAAAEASAESDVALAITMDNLAEAIEGGTAKFLDMIRTKTQIEQLRSMVGVAQSQVIREKYSTYSEREAHKYDKPTREAADYVEYPDYTLYRQDWARMAREAADVTGLKQRAAKILSQVDDVTDEYVDFAKENTAKVSGFLNKYGAPATFKSKPTAERAIKANGLRGIAIVLPIKRGENRIVLSPSEAIKRGVWEKNDHKRVTLSPDIAEEFLSKAQAAGIQTGWYLDKVKEKRNRFKAMGILTSAELRSAVREYVDIQEVAKGPDKIKEKEREMVGRKADGLDFFPTPEGIAEELVDLAGIEEGMTVLEPSAGMGHLAEKIRDYGGVQPDVVEYSSSRRELLEMKGFNVIGNDFLESSDKQYDRIIMNPPFSQRRDAEHVKHAYESLKPGGRLVAIMGEGVFFGKDKKATAFREWLDEVGGDSEKLPEGAFMDANLPATTGANARRVVIEKLSEQPQFAKKSIVNGKDSPAGLYVKDAEQVISQFKTRFPGASKLDFVVKKTQAEAFGSNSDIKERVKGAYFGSKGQVLLIADNLSNKGEAERVLQHEVLAHYGLNLFGKEAKDAILERVADSRNDPSLKSIFKEVEGDNYDGDDTLLIAEEVIAYIAEKTSIDGRLQKAWDKIARFIVEKLRKLGFIDGKVSVFEVRDLVRSMAEGIRDGKKQKTFPESNKGQFKKTKFEEVADDSDDIFSDIDNEQDKEGLERGQELLKKSWEWAKNHTDEFIKTGGMKTLTLDQVVDIGKKVVPAAKTYADKVERMMTERNIMQDESAKLALKWQKMAKQSKNRVAHVMHESTMEGIDPSYKELQPSEVVIVGGMNNVNMALGKDVSGAISIEPERVVASIANLKLLAKRKHRAGRAMISAQSSPDSLAMARQNLKRATSEWKHMRNAIAKDKGREDKFEPLRKKFLGLDSAAQAIFVEARDMYLKRSERMEKALKATVERSELADKQKKAAIDSIRVEFESSRLDGVYFPLFREGSYFVKAKKARTDLETPQTYEKTVGKIMEVLVAGETKYRSQYDESLFDTIEEATEWGKSWATKDAAMASSKSRGDLLGLSLEAKELPDGKGWVLQDSMDDFEFTMHNTAKEAEHYANSLGSDYHDMKYGKLDEVQTQEDFAVSGSFLADVFNVMKKGEVNDSTQDAVYQLYLETLPQLSQRKHFIHRKKTAGFSQNALESFASNMTHQAHQISKLEAKDGLEQSLTDMSEQAKEAEQKDALLAGQVRDRLKQQHEWVMSPSNASWTNWTSSFGFVMYLGVSPAAALVNLTQTVIIGMPVLAAETNWKTAAQELKNAAKMLNMRETLLGDEAIKTADLDAVEKRAFEIFENSGKRNRSQAHMLAGIGDTDSLQNSQTFQNAMGKVGHLFHKAEIANRDVTFLAAFRIAQKAHKDWTIEEQALWAAHKVQNIHFNYENYNRAPIMQSDTAKLFLMFKSYSQHVIYYMMKNAHDWGKEGPEGKAAQTRLLGMLGITLAMGGVSALPIGMMGMAVGGVYANSKFGTKKAVQGAAGIAGLMAMASLMWDDDEPFDWETEVRAFLRSMGGDDLESLVFRGVVNAVAGIDVSARVSLDSLLIREANRELEGRDMAAHLLEQAAGPVVGYGVSGLTAMQLWKEDHGYRAVERMMPTFAKNIMKSGRYANEGVANLKGDKVVEKDLLSMYGGELNVWNVFWQAAGFSPDKVARQYQKTNDVKNYEGHISRRKKRILTDYYTAHIENDPEGMRDAIKRSEDWNEANPKAKPINSRSLGQSLRTRLRYRAESVNGANINKAYWYLLDELHADQYEDNKHRRRATRHRQSRESRRSREGID